MHYFDKFLETAKNKGWVIEEAVEKNVFPQVYRGHIDEFEEITEKYRLISDPDYTTWFVIGEHLKCDDMIALKYKILGGYEDDMGTGLTADKIIENATGLPYLWDTFKNISIGASMDNGETETKWWDKHFPFIMSSKYGYDEFYAINTDDGSIEYGTEPMYEETDKVADTLEEFFQKVLCNDIELF